MAKAAAKAETKTKDKKAATRPGKPSKRYQSITRAIEKRPYPLPEALDLIKKSATAKFDETIEAHFVLGIDPTQTAQQIRGSVKLPYGTGKEVKILVFASGAEADEASQAGAMVANESIISKIEKGSVPYDLVIATPESMPSLAKLARVLGVRGLMPNPKSGTITSEVKEAIEARRHGQIDFKNDQAGLHLPLGKASFEAKKLLENFQTLYGAVQSSKPPKINAGYILRITLSSTMGPGVKVDLESLKSA